MSTPSSPLRTEQGSSTSQFRFGTVNDPETKPFNFTVPNNTVLSPEPVTHLRRSPRLSGVPPFLSDAIRDAEVSRPGTPDNDYAQDEPSSILASRIMRAQDNPSPPPDPPSSPIKLLDQPFPFAGHDSPNKAFGDNRSITPSYSSIPYRTSSPPPTPTAQHACTPLSLDPSLPIPETQPHHGSNVVLPNDRAHESSSNHPNISDRLEEEAVAKELTIPVDENEPIGVADIQMDNCGSAADTEEQPTTSPRRSTRPRRSIAIYGFQSQDVPSTSSQPVIQPSHETRGRSTEHMSGFPDAVSPVREKSPSRKKVVVSKRQLGSLSPNSVTLLNHLLPPPLSPLKEQESWTPSTSHATIEQVSVPAQRVFPIRHTSPQRPNPLQKIRLQPADLDDPNRTPARRVPISPTKATTNLFTAGPSRTNIFNIPPTDSPARRIMLSDADGVDVSPSKGRLLGSPVRPVPQRSRSVEPQSLARPVPLRSSSAEPTAYKGKEPLRTPSVQRSQAVTRNILPKSIPEEGQFADDIGNQKSLPSLPKNSSRPRQTTSRIPRMKPYIRLQNTSGQSTNKASGISRRVDWSKASSSTESKSKTLSGGLRPPIESSTKVKTALPTPSPGLKRKRGSESTPVKSSSTKQSSPVKLSPVVVVPSLKEALSRTAVRPQQSSTPDTKPEIQKNSVAVEPQPQPDHETTSSDMDVTVSPSTNVENPFIDKEPPSISVSVEVHRDESNASSSSDSTLRRTTRARRTAQPVPGLPSNRRAERPPPSRRKTPMIHDSGPFSNMSAVALRALTTSNTTKNQKYLAATLEMEVIRKEGPRPDSPVMKVKTISEKEKEEKERDRNARAERRARRNQDGSDDTAMLVSNSTQSDTDEDDWDQLAMSPTPKQHMRGAGEDEDYETPDKLRPMKRMRLLDDGEDASEKKRVKWDRGLCTEMYLDEIKPRRQQARSNTPVMKGCLAPTAKALILDTLGNLPNAESPLKNLVQENVIVKKFVYDTDVEEPSVPPEPPKNTRSKSRKSKS
ncbi:hypothetical protein VKT23_004160 [Stygiomarasmius scandens]|uniref:Uncharacterized protein n=1 Tax=Marasmiellus scandens TaxID=2682957 RepID=A0ABR1JU58_9AGAR